MLFKSKDDIIRLIEMDEWMMDILRAAKTLQLPDWWVCAGFVRSKIWDTLHGFTDRTTLPDVDFIYFDCSQASETLDKQFENQLKQIIPHIPWSVKNQARMHIANNIPPYLSAVDAISKFPETATALGVKLDDHDQVILTAPCGIDDVLEMIIKPTPYFSECQDRVSVYEKRIEQKNFNYKWPMVTVIHTAIIVETDV